MLNKTIFVLKIIFIVLIAAFISYNIFYYIKEKEEQHISDAFITVKSPRLEKNAAKEADIKESLSGKIKNVSFYQAHYRGIEYSVIFTEFSGESNLESGVESIKNVFIDDNFIFSAVNNQINDMQAVLIDGSFQKGEKSYGIKEQLVKKGHFFWQVIVVFPQSQKNDKIADNFIRSIDITSPQE
jgi:hypothetical protein